MENIDKFIKALEDADVTYGVIKMSDEFRDILVALLKEQESVIEALKSDLDETLAVLGDQPEIVRCRECKYGCLIDNWKAYMCRSPEQDEKTCVHFHKPEWFCADGARKGGAELGCE